MDLSDHYKISKRMRPKTLRGTSEIEKEEETDHLRQLSVLEERKDNI